MIGQGFSAGLALRACAGLVKAWLIKTFKRDKAGKAREIKGRR